LQEQRKLQLLTKLLLLSMQFHQQQKLPIAASAFVDLCFHHYYY
jgi:hypothetical protein